MLNVIVLGSAAGGGVPQWNCNCPVCLRARQDPALHDTQMSAAVSADGGRNWFVINASPDIRQQIIATPALHPRPGPLRHSPIAGVILTNGEVDAVAGLLSLREGSPFAIHAPARVLATLAENSIFNVLSPALVPRHAMPLDTPFEPLLQDGTPSGLTVEAFAVPGKPAWYIEGATADPGDTIGLCLRGHAGGDVLFIPACAEMTPALADRLHGAALLFFDGTLWQDDEMIRAGLGHKTGGRMGHMAMSGATGTLAAFAGVDVGEKVFVHVNNSNPVLLPGSQQRRLAESAGWRLVTPGTEFTT